MTDKTKDTLLEKPIFVRVGLLFFLVRPLTLAQVWEIGAIVKDMKDLDFGERFNPFAKSLERYDDIKLCVAVIMVMIFRSRWKRWLFKKYISNRLTMASYSILINYAMQSFNAAFFLSSLTFLKGMREMTKKTNTAEATALGDSWEEL